MSRDDLTLNSVSIANLSLAHLGMKSIDDIDTDAAASNPSAIAIDKFWGPCRNDVFREFKWPFATVIDPMYHRTDVTSDDYPEWEFFTTYPTSAETVWYVFGETDVENKEENNFEVVYNPTLAERILCCDCDTQNTAYVEYTYNVTDPAFWDNKFIMAFSYRLAASMCMELVGDEKKALQLMQIYTTYMQDAKRISHYEKKRKPAQKNPIVDARG